MSYRGAGRDVTDQAQIAQKLEQATLESEAANRAKSEFLSIMSHELRKPLNAVIGFSEVVSEQMFGPAGSPKYVKYASNIQASRRHLLDMINDILDISRIASGHLDLAEKIDAAMNEAARRGLDVVINAPMSKWALFDAGDFPVTIVPPANLPQKSRPRGPRKIDPGI